LKISKGGNQNSHIEEEQITQWPKEKVQKDKQRSTKHTYKSKDRVTRTRFCNYLAFKSFDYDLSSVKVILETCCALN
jgi:4-alpha-glucanotransferase